MSTGTRTSLTVNLASCLTLIQFKVVQLNTTKKHKNTEGGPSLRFCKGGSCFCICE